MNICEVVATRSNCIKRQIGSILVKDHRVLSCGFNGVAKGLRNCFEGGCERCNDPTIESGTKLDECICNHAEENAIIYAAQFGVSIKNSVIYTTDFPCLMCCKMICNSSITRVYYKKEYPSLTKGAELFQKAGIPFIHVD